MTRRDNYIRFLRRQDPEFIPDARVDQNALGFTVLNERGPADPENPMVNEGMDWFGVMWKYVPNVCAPMVDPAYPPLLEDICDWREIVKFPDLDKIDFKAGAEKELSSPNYDPDKLNLIVLPYGCFERMHCLMGMENACCALMTDPEECAAFFEAVMDYKLKLLDKLCEAFPVDAVEYSDDWGHQHSTFFSPEVYRTLIMPQIKRFTAECERRDLPLIVHCCGKVETIIEDMMEAGIKNWSSVQTVNDVDALIRKYGDKLTFTGGMDVFGGKKVSPEEMDRIVGERIDTMCRGGALIPFGTSVVEGLPEAACKAVAERPHFFLDPKNRILPQ